MLMSKLGRHRRTIKLPDEEPWVIPAPAPERRSAEREPSPAVVPERETRPAPAVPARL